MPATREQALFGAAILKLSFMIKGIHDQPGFRVVYHGTLREFDLTNGEVDTYIEAHRDELMAKLQPEKDPA